MPLDADAVRRGCRGAQVDTAQHLCRAEIDRFREAAASRRAADVGCTQEAPLFAEVAAEREQPLTFVNLRETAGWSVEGASAGPKMAALIAAAAEPVPDFALVGLSSEGVTLVYGRDERAVEAARLLADHLDVTVLISRPKDLAPQRVTEFPVVKGTIRSAQGHFGAFELTIDDFAAPVPSSRGAMAFGLSRNGAISRCDLVVDLSGRRAAVSRARSARRLSARRPRRSCRGAACGAQSARPGRRVRQAALYHLHRRSLRAFALEDCRLPALSRPLSGRRDRARRQSCGDRPEHLRRLWPVRRRLSNRRCRLCAAAGRYAAAQAACNAHDLREAGGTRAIVLLHDEPHGAPLIDALARHGEGLPANVLPLSVNEVTQVGLEAVAAAFAYGASGCDSSPREATPRRGGPAPRRSRSPTRS